MLLSVQHIRQTRLRWPVIHISKPSLTKGTYHMCGSGIVLGVVHRQKEKRPLQGSHLCNLDEILLHIQVSGQATQHY